MKETEIIPASPVEKKSVLVAMGTAYNVEPKVLLSTLKDTAFKGATDSQMMALCLVAHEYGLNPFTKEIYAFPDKKSGGIIPVIGVDGWYNIVNAHAEFDGVEFKDIRDQGGLVAITCKLHRKDREYPTEITEYLEECRRETGPWKSHPTRMLRHRAFIQCARIAFSISVSDPEDAAGALENSRNVTPHQELQTTENPFTKQSATVEEEPFVDDESTMFQQGNAYDGPEFDIDESREVGS